MNEKEQGDVLNFPIEKTTSGIYRCGARLIDLDVKALNDLLFGIEEGTPSVERCIEITTQRERVYKPKNLKYPNKKRKRRILKKWKKRFGFIPEQRIFIPKAQIQCDPLGGVKITAQKISE